MDKMQELIVLSSKFERESSENGVGEVEAITFIMNDFIGSVVDNFGKQERFPDREKIVYELLMDGLKNILEDNKMI